MNQNIRRKFSILNNLFVNHFAHHFEFQSSGTWRHTGSEDWTIVFLGDQPRSQGLSCGVKRRDPGNEVAWRRPLPPDSARKTGFVHDCRITKFSQCAELGNKGESGFSYRFNLDVSLNYNTILQTHFLIVLSLCKKVFFLHRARARASLSDLHSLTYTQ